MENNFISYTSVHRIQNELHFGNELKLVDFRVFEINSASRELTGDFLQYLENDVKEGNDVYGYHIFLMTKFYLFFRNPLTSKNKSSGSYKRDRRKFSLGSLFDQKNLTFWENKKLENIKDPHKKLHAIYTSMEQTDKRKLSISLLNDTLYFDPTILEEVDAVSYSDLNTKILIEFEDFLYSPIESNIDSKSLSDSFRNKFRPYQDNPMFKRFLYECEGVYDLVWEYFFNDLLTDLDREHKLTPTEKDIYQVMYNRQKLFDYHIPIFEEVLVSFWNHLKTEWQRILIWLIIDTSPATDKEIIISFFGKQLERFLKFYPIWLDVVRLDDELNSSDLKLLLNQVGVEGRFEITKSADGEIILHQILSTDESIEGQDGADTNLSIIETISSPVKQELQDDLESLNQIINWKLTEKQKTVINKLNEGFTQEEIAAEAGVAQSAISQRLMSARKELKKILK